MGGRGIASLYCNIMSAALSPDFVGGGPLPIDELACKRGDSASSTARCVNSLAPLFGHERASNRVNKQMSVTDRGTSQVVAARGRPFEKGNGGRRLGSKNRSSLVSAALLEGEVEDLVRKAVEMAKAGDVQMLKFLLSRMLPRERPIKFDLPIMNFADDAVEALGSIAQAVSEGTITPGEGAALATLINSYARAIDIADLVARIDVLEAKIKGEFAP